MAARSVLAILASLLILAQTAIAGPAIQESAREIPVAYNVDVVVVGGSTGAVAAAVQAAESGAKVFLAAPYPYLGEDMTATLRLWLSEGETPKSPLAVRLFGDTPEPLVDPNRISFTYEADPPSSSQHKDKTPPSLLTDGRWASASSESVQYDGDVTITADLGKSQEIEKVRVAGFRRAAANKAGSGFDVTDIAVSLSDDKQTWTQAVVLKDPKETTGTGDGLPILFEAPLGAKARYVKLVAKKPEDCKRMLLGEIELIGKEPTQAAPVKTAVAPPRPMHVKKTLDDALLAAGVQYLYSCYATDVLRDAEGNPCGIVMANRAGRQAVIAKVIIDATERRWLGRMAGAKWPERLQGTQKFKRVVIGGEPKEGLSSRTIGPPFQGPYPNQAKTSSGTFKVIEYTLELPLADDGYAAWMAADQQARTLTYHPEQQFTADRLFLEPQFDAAAQPSDIPRMYFLNVTGSSLALIDRGTEVGAAAAQEAKKLPAPKGARLPGKVSADAKAIGEVREFLGGVRPVQQLPTIPQEARDLPVLGTYDVVVIGGGTGGAPAGIGAARQGAKTLVVEYLHGLGGVGTLGAISNYYWGNRVGFSATVTGGSNAWVMEQKSEWWRSELLKAGGELWYGTIGCGAVVKDGKAVGAIVATPQGRGVVLAKVVIDATGNADIATAAGAQTIYTDASEFGMQGTGLPGLKLGDRYNNTDFTITDETDMVDVWQMFVFSKNKYLGAFDHGKLIDTRERRRIVGDFTISLLDQINQRKYPDTICRAYSNFDTHGYTVDPYTFVEHPEKKGFYVDIPYRSMLPKGLEAILVTGLGISSERDAVPLIRMQADIQNGGYAAGVVAANAARYDQPLRKVDFKAVQGHLVDIGNLPESVLTDKDSYPIPDARLAEAVVELPKGKGAAAIFAEPKRSLPLLRQAYASAAGDDKLAYARALAVLGDATGLEVMLADVKQAGEWDRGWNYKGMGQFGHALSPVDIAIVSLGYTKDRRALAPILEKLQTLSAEEAFSHHRAVGLALELIGDPEAAKPLADLLAKPGMSGYAHTSIDVAIERETPGGTNGEITRRESLRELLLARALYRCGDYEGVGKKILEIYTQDLRGHLARHAKAVLEAGAKK